MGLGKLGLFHAVLVRSRVLHLLSAELKGLGADFTFGFIQVMDGEKDPRNLLVAFQIVRDLIAKNYALGEPGPAMQSQLGGGIASP